jgi:hypothetical protein
MTTKRLNHIKMIYMFFKHHQINSFFYEQMIYLNESLINNLFTKNKTSFTHTHSVVDFLRTKIT